MDEIDFKHPVFWILIYVILGGLGLIGTALLSSYVYKKIKGRKWNE